MKVLFVNFNYECIPYDKNVHAIMVYKFLYWHNGGDEIILAGCDSVFCSTHKALLITANEIDKNLPMKTPDGVGEVQRKRGIVDWGSLGFMIETPDEYRARIVEALGIKDGCQR